MATHTVPASSAAVEPEAAPSVAPPAVEPSVEVVTALPVSTKPRSVVPVASEIKEGVAAAAAVDDVAPSPAAAEAPSAQAPAAAASEAPATEVAAGVVEAELPLNPAREDIVAGFDAIRADLDACVDGGHGTSVANVTISGVGRVTYAMVDGACVCERSRTRRVAAA